MACGAFVVFVELMFDGKAFALVEVDAARIVRVSDGPGAGAGVFEGLAEELAADAFAAVSGVYIQPAEKVVVAAGKAHDVVIFAGHQETAILDGKRFGVLLERGDLGGAVLLTEFEGAGAVVYLADTVPVFWGVGSNEKHV